VACRESHAITGRTAMIAVPSSGMKSQICPGKVFLATSSFARAFFEGAMGKDKRFAIFIVGFLGAAFILLLLLCIGAEIFRAIGWLQ